MLGNGAAKENLAFLFTVGQRTQPFGQAPLGHHITRQFSRALNIIGRAGSHHLFAVNHLFRYAATEQTRDLAFQTLHAETVTVLFGQEHGDAQRLSARNNADLVDRIVRWHQTTDNGVSRFVIRGEFFVILTHHHGTALGAHHDLVLGLVQILHIHQAFAGTRRKQGRLVDKICKVSTGKPRCAARNNTGFKVVCTRHLAQMDFQNLFAAADIRQRHHHLAVKAARA